MCVYISVYGCDSCTDALRERRCVDVGYTDLEGTERVYACAERKGGTCTLRRGGRGIFGCREEGMGTYTYREEGEGIWHVPSHLLYCFSNPSLVNQPYFS